MTEKLNSEGGGRIIFVSKIIMAAKPARAPYDRYPKGNLIGFGTYGKIYATRDGLAIKRMSIRQVTPISSVTLSEIVWPTNLDHPNIIKYHEIIYRGFKVYIVMDGYQTDLARLSQPLRQRHFKAIARQLINGVAYLTKHHIIHRDIKTSNIFCRLEIVDDVQRITVALGDFGLATGRVHLKKKRDTIVYTWGFRAPEIVLGLPYDSSADVWALGATLYQIYTSDYLIDAAYEDSWDFLRKIGKIVGGVTLTIDDYFKPSKHEFLAKLSPQTSPGGLIKDDPLLDNLITTMVHPHPQHRISILAAQSHPYLGDSELTPSPPQLSDNPPILSPRSIDATILRLVILAKRINLPLERISTAAEILHRYDAKKEITPDTVSLVIMSCLTLSVIHVDHVLSGSFVSWCRVSGDTFEQDDVTRMVQDILNTLNHNIGFTTQYDRLVTNLDDHDQDKAKDLFLAILPISKLYGRSDLSQLCLQLTEDDEPRTILVEFYTQHSDGQVLVPWLGELKME
jgi:serine/threonine protein kinase